MKGIVPLVALLVDTVLGVPECAAYTEGSICTDRGLLLPPATMPGVVGYWSFDDAYPLDVSGNGLHGGSPVEAGPGLGVGASARVSNSAITIPASPLLDTPDFTYSLWLFLPKLDELPAGEQWCPIIRKGGADVTKKFVSSPGLFVDQTHRLKVVMTTTDNADEFFISRSRLKYQIWYHVAIVRISGAHQTRLYVNGVLDTEAPTTGYTQSNEFPLYLGTDPWSPCKRSMLIDEVKVLNRPMIPDEIEAEASFALGGIEPSFVRLGCADCNLDVATQACPANYHICTTLDLHSGAYAVARTLGWIEKGTHVWSHAPEQNKQAQEGGGATAPTNKFITETYGLGLCCADM